ncbi:MAG: hypothetical protein AB7N80_13185 [Bdellovibrionales bacterium]
MKNKIILLVAATLGITAHAEIGHKAPLKADFHSLIIESSNEREGLAHGIHDSIASKKPQKVKKADQRRVTDFVDVEIGWGEAPQMVDRRFDSVGEPLLALPDPKAVAFPSDETANRRHQ